MQIHYLKLTVSDLSTSLSFYQNILGAVCLSKTTDSIVLEFGPGQTQLVLQEKKNLHYQPSYQDRYWKIGLTLHDLDMACDCLSQLGVPFSGPSQFVDIGYLSHLQDPDGYTIELLQTTFKDQTKVSVTTHPQHPLKQQTQFAHISLRVKDIQAALSFYQEQLKMTLCGWMSAHDYQFSLYFLGDCHLQAPNQNLEAVENRPWLWQRKTTFIELQHVWGREQQVDFAYRAPNLEQELGVSKIGLIDSALSQDTFVSAPEGMLYSIAPSSKSQS